MAYFLPQPLRLHLRLFTGSQDPFHPRFRFAIAQSIFGLQCSNFHTRLILTPGFHLLCNIHGVTKCLRGTSAQFCMSLRSAQRTDDWTGFSSPQLRKFPEWVTDPDWTIIYRPYYNLMIDNLFAILSVRVWNHWEPKKPLVDRRFGVGIGIYAIGLLLVKNWKREWKAVCIDDD